MPRVGSLGPISFWVYARDHNPPHFHATTATTAALISIADFRVLEGSLPRGSKKAVLQWAEQHQAELWAAWDRLNPGSR